MESDKADTSGVSIADLLDVHILDIAAEIEALLRGVREIQRGVLRMRGLHLRGASASPSSDVRERLKVMRRECDALCGVIEQAISGVETPPNVEGARP